MVKGSFQNGLRSSQCSPPKAALSVCRTVIKFQNMWTHIDFITYSLQREHSSLSPDIAKSNVRLNTKNSAVHLINEQGGVGVYQLYCRIILTPNYWLSQSPILSRA